MKRYQFEVVTSVLVIEAQNEEEAEAKYNAYWLRGSEICPCGDVYCECVDEIEETYHNTIELEGEGN